MSHGLAARVTAVALLAVLLLPAAGCTRRSRPAAALPPGAGTVADDAVPAELGGFLLEPEDVTAELEAAGDKAYVTDVRLWALREGERLRATLQVARFAPDAPVEEEGFRELVAGQVGGTTPRIRVVGDDTVYVSGGTRQTYYAWFRGPELVLLTVPVETRSGRALLRAALQEVAR